MASPCGVFPRLRSTSADVEGQGTFVSSVINLAASAMGCGVLALPRSFAVCGVRWSLAFLVIFSMWVELSLRWLVACGRFSGKRGFKENAQYFLGTGAAKAVHFCQILLLCGGIVTVFVTAASLLGCSAREMLASICTEEVPGSGAPLRRLCRAHPAPCMPRERVLLLISLAVFPLACQKSLHSLTGVSMLSFLCLSYFFVVLIWRLTSQALHATWAPWPAPIAQVDSSLFWQGPPVLLMSLLCHTTMMQLDAELSREAKPKAGAVIRLVILGLSMPCYALVGVGGLYLHGSDVSSNVLEDFVLDPWMAFARLTLGLMNVAKLATAVITLREALTASLGPSWRRFLRGSLGRAAAAAASLAAGALAAQALGSLSKVLSLLGCTLGVLFSLCLPALLYASLLRDVAALTQHSKKRDLEAPLLPRPEPQLGVLTLPKKPADWACQWLLCAAVFVGGLVFGGLGLASWLHT